MPVIPVRPTIAAIAALGVAATMIISGPAPSDSVTEPAPTSSPFEPQPEPDRSPPPAAGRPSAGSPDVAIRPPVLRDARRMRVTGSFEGPGEDLFLQRGEFGGPYEAFDGRTGGRLWRYETEGFLLGRADTAGDAAEELLFASFYRCRAPRREAATLELVSPGSGRSLWRTDVDLGACPDAQLVPWDDDFGWAGDLSGDGKPDVVIARDGRRRMITVVDGATGERIATVRDERGDLFVVPDPSDRQRSLFLAARPISDEQMRAVLFDANGTVTWRSEPFPRPPSSVTPIQPVALARLNGDAVSDLLLASGDAVLAFDGATGTSLWRAAGVDVRATYPLVHEPWSIVGDVDGDRADDVVFTRPVDRSRLTLDAEMIGVLSGRDGSVMWEQEARRGANEGPPHLVPSLTGSGSPDLVQRLAYWEDEFGNFQVARAYDGASGTLLWETEEHDLLGDGVDASGDGVPDLWTHDGEGGIYREGDAYANGRFEVSLHSGRDLGVVTAFDGSPYAADPFSVTPIDVDGDGVRELFVVVDGVERGDRAFVRGARGELWRAR